MFFYIRSDYSPYGMCYTCAEAFMLGQQMKDQALSDIYDLFTVPCGEQMHVENVREHTDDCVACAAEAAAAAGDYYRKLRREG
jgi:hypothetical protein